MAGEFPKTRARAKTSMKNNNPKLQNNGRLVSRDDAETETSLWEVDDRRFPVKFDEDELLCPVCGFQHTHIMDGALIPRHTYSEENVVIPMHCENGHVFTICLGPYKGRTQIWTEIGVLPFAVSIKFERPIDG
jgi:hypothetical protein